MPTNSMPGETAMLLTQQEWEDVASFCNTYLSNTMWVEYEPQRSAVTETHGQAFIDEIERKRRLAHRIVDAAEV